MLGIPQHAEAFYSFAVGLWTTCIHLDYLPEGSVQGYRGQVSRYRNQITSLQQVISQYFEVSMNSFNNGYSKMIYWSKRVKRRYMSEALS